MDGEPVLVVCHDEDDHSWAFLDGKPFDPADTMVVGMSEVVTQHPEVVELAHLPPGWSAHRLAAGHPWSKKYDDWKEG